MLAIVALVAGSRRIASSSGATLVRSARTSSRVAATIVPPARQNAAAAARSAAAGIGGSRLDGRTPEDGPLLRPEAAEGLGRGDDHIDLRKERDVAGGVGGLREVVVGVREATTRR